MRDPSVDRAHEIAGRVGNEVGGERLVEMSVGLSWRWQQQIAGGGELSLE